MFQKCPICGGSGAMCSVCKGKKIISTETGLPPSNIKEKISAEMFLCGYLNCSREELQWHISKNPSKIISAMEKFAEFYTENLVNI